MRTKHDSRGGDKGCAQNNEPDGSAKKEETGRAAPHDEGEVSHTL
jgi:hypothetical protein